MISSFLTRGTQTIDLRPPTAVILYAEDYPLVRSAVRDQLTEEGWRVVTCADGLSALRLIEGGESFDLLLLDNGLPGVGGLDLLRRARRLAHRRATPVVMFSADLTPEEAAGAGAAACLRKPQDLHRLAETIRELLPSDGVRAAEAPRAVPAGRAGHA